MSANGRGIETEIPGILLGGLTIQTGPDPTDPTRKAIMVGPVVLVIPLDDVARKAVVRGLIGVEIASTIPEKP